MRGETSMEATIITALFVVKPCTGGQDALSDDAK